LRPAFLLLRLWLDIERLMSVFLVRIWHGLPE
jgi:hypothetical protein